ncbi:iron-containing alcohol dehydrogenase [Poseidonocella sp. HB161398]|uniref:iron-containing alcohol dehydrogenase n=1 Tax=Poseidonocella sp. HB161398 TaxID=2320855 RepID=UPI00197D0FAA|nr:iron-containing alcohol dehydrogenase [Poseidonocella sp. HB161398]
MAPFGLRLPGDIRFGRGKASEALPGIAAMAERILVIHGRDGHRAGWLTEGLRRQGAEVLGLAAPGEPDLPMLEAAVAAARDFGAGAVVACGGGAALDLGKAVAALAAEAHPPAEYLELVGTGRKLAGPLLPFIAIPTTAGTGAEVTKNAVIGVPAHRRKVSLRDDRMLAQLAIVDPSLTDGCPKSVTLASGLDAVVQVIEPYLSPKASVVTDALCEKAIPAGLAALATLMERDDPEARDALAWTSLAGGIALANAGLGAVHGLAGPLGGVTGGAHGAICGRLLQPVLWTHMRVGLPAPADQRIDRVTRWIGQGLKLGATGANLEQWASAQGLPRLGEMGLDPVDIPGVAEAARGSSSMKANPVELSQAQLETILEMAL